MILIGQYDSPFVRRVGIAMHLYGLAYEHRPWGVFGDAEKVAAHNPVMRVPALVLADGDVLIDSAAILDYLDGLVDPAHRLYPQAEPGRHRALKVAALASGLADKAIALFYEQRLHEHRSEVWMARCGAQTAAAAAALEADRAARGTPWWFGATMGHADIAVACVLRHANEALPGLLDMPRYPLLAAHAARCEALDVFQTVSQPFLAPA